MRPLVRSYGVISTRTLSPASTRMRFLRILPAVWAMISWSFSSLTRNVAFGSSSTTNPGNSSSSSFDIGLLVGIAVRAERQAPDGLQPIRAHWSESTPKARAESGVLHRSPPLAPPNPAAEPTPYRRKRKSVPAGSGSDQPVDDADKRPPGH